VTGCREKNGTRKAKKGVKLAIDLEKKTRRERRGGSRQGVEEKGAKESKSNPGSEKKIRTKSIIKRERNLKHKNAPKRGGGKGGKKIESN